MQLSHLLQDPELESNLTQFLSQLKVAEEAMRFFQSTSGLDVFMGAISDLKYVLSSLLLVDLLGSANCEIKIQIVAIQYSRNSIITGPTVLSYVVPINVFFLRI